MSTHSTIFQIVRSERQKKKEQKKIKRAHIHTGRARVVVRQGKIPCTRKFLPLCLCTVQAYRRSKKGKKQSAEPFCVVCSVKTSFCRTNPCLSRPLEIKKRSFCITKVSLYRLLFYLFECEDTKKASDNVQKIRSIL